MNPKLMIKQCVVTLKTCRAPIGTQ